MNAVKNSVILLDIIPAPCRGEKGAPDFQTDLRGLGWC